MQYRTTCKICCANCCTTNCHYFIKDLRILWHFITFVQQFAQQILDVVRCCTNVLRIVQQFLTQKNKFLLQIHLQQDLSQCVIGPWKWWFWLIWNEWSLVYCWRLSVYLACINNKTSGRCQGWNEFFVCNFLNFNVLYITALTDIFKNKTFWKKWILEMT